MKRQSKGNGDLFIEGSGQLRLVDKSAEQQALEKGKVECLGMTFDNEDARRSYFIERLRETGRNFFVVTGSRENRLLKAIGEVKALRNRAWQFAKPLG